MLHLEWFTDEHLVRMLDIGQANALWRGAQGALADPTFRRRGDMKDPTELLESAPLFQSQPTAWPERWPEAWPTDLPVGDVMVSRIPSFPFAVLLCGASSFAQTATLGSGAVDPRPQIDSSKAHAWAGLVADFITNPRLTEWFPAAHTASRFKALVPEGSLKMGDGWGVASTGDLEKGIAGLEYELADGANASARVLWVTVYLPETDPDGVEVKPMVIAQLKRKLRSPWRGYPHPGGGFYWENRRALRIVRVRSETSLPTGDGTKREGVRWVAVHFGRVEGFEEP